MVSNIKKQVWLVDIIRRNHLISFTRINEKWIENDDLNPYGKSMQVRTFHRHRNEIREMYGIDIKCNKPTNEYFINYETTSDNEDIKSWILDSISIDNLLRENKSLKERILFGRMHSGQSYLPLILQAMRDNRQIVFTYKRYEVSEKYTTTLSPYCLKAFAQRWYVVGITPRHPGEIRIYALDRVFDMKPTDNSFVYPRNFSPEDYFADSIGIYHADKPTSLILLKVEGNTRNYIRSLPLHQSQVEIEDNSNENYSTFILRVAIDEDLIREIMKNGNNITVIEPVELREEIITRLKKSINNYETK